MLIHVRSLMLIAAASALVLAGCEKPNKVPGSNQPDPAVAKAPPPKAEDKAPPKMPPKMPPKVPMAKRPLFAGAHILIQYKGSMRANPGIKRSKKDALEFAKKLTEEAKKNPGGFKEMAKKHSNGPTGPRGGVLGVWPKGGMVPAFDTAIEKLEENQISDAPVETPFGFHIMMRLPIYAGAHILIAYKGAMRADPKVTRNKDDALKLAKELAEKARKDPKTFAELAKKHSNGPSSVKGGDLGFWAPGKMVPAFDVAVAKLEVGGISEIVTTPFGYHVIIRKAPPKFAP